MKRFWIVIRDPTAYVIELWILSVWIRHLECRFEHNDINVDYYKLINNPFAKCIECIQYSWWSIYCDFQLMALTNKKYKTFYNSIFNNYETE